MRVYIGNRNSSVGGGSVKVKWLNSTGEVTASGALVKSDSYPLKHHLLHSPDGFNWGYIGSGSSDLARCLLWEFFGHEPPKTMYFDFRDQVIAKIQEDQFELWENEVRDWCVEWKRSNG